MSRFQIFIPHTPDQQIEDMQPAVPLTRVGLKDLIGGSSAQLSIGPEDQQGVIVSWPDTGDLVTGYRPDEQTWIPAVPREGLEAKRYYVGIWNDKRPTPKDLRRPYPYRGKAIALNDHNEWIIPTAGELPTDMILADDGTWKFEVQRQFHALSQDADKWRDLLLNYEDGDTFEWSDLCEFIVPILKLNYMLTDEVVGYLRLFGQDNIVKALHAVCGVVIVGQ